MPEPTHSEILQRIARIEARMDRDDISRAERQRLHDQHEAAVREEMRLRRETVDKTLSDLASKIEGLLQRESGLTGFKNGVIATISLFSGLVGAVLAAWWTSAKERLFS